MPLHKHVLAVRASWKLLLLLLLRWWCSLLLSTAAVSHRPP
jgi:hypothetical protein